MAQYVQDATGKHENTLSSQRDQQTYRAGGVNNNICGTYQWCCYAQKRDHCEERSYKAN